MLPYALHAIACSRDVIWAHDTIDIARILRYIFRIAWSEPR
jgi:hypothetical protein